MFDRACLAHGIEHKLTEPLSPVDDRPSRAHEPDDQGRDDRASCPLPDLESLKAHVLAFVAAYNFTKRLKALR